MTTTNCLTGYGREILLRMFFFNDIPPWEDGTASYDFPPVSFKLNLHKTADPGEAGGPSTNVADYTGYAVVTITRSSSFWTLTGGGTFTPTISNTNSISWPENTGTDQDIYAVSISFYDAALASIGIARAVFSPAVTVDGDATDGDTPRIGAGSLTFAFR